jgi:DNA-binding beta-propeller fold protein YncE
MHRACPSKRVAQEPRESRRDVLRAVIAGGAIASLMPAPTQAQAYVTDQAQKLPGSTAKEYVGPHRPRPRFKFEDFPIKLLPGKQLGRTIAIACSPKNSDLFLLNYTEYGPYIPRTTEARLGPIVHLDRSGRYINSWGGPDSLPKIAGKSQWARDPDNVEVDDDGNVWVTGWNKEDDAILKFSPDGAFIRQYGQKGLAGDDDNTELVNSPPSVYHDVKNHELFVADGYGNHRVIAFNSDTGKFTRMWGAYGRKPSALSPGEGYKNPVHKIARAPDGLMYVADRTNSRVQEFELVPGGVHYLREVHVGPGTGLMGSCFDIAFTPDNKYMYVADGMGMRVWTVDRKTFEVLGWANAAPEPEGDDNIGPNRIPLHRFALLPNGDILLARGRNSIGRLKYLGVS